MGDVIEGELTDETEESISPSAVDLVKDDTAQKDKKKKNTSHNLSYFISPVTHLRNRFL